VDKKEQAELAKAIGIFVAGCMSLFGVVALVLCIVPGLIYIFFNGFLPVLGFSYPLTFFQCCIAAMALVVVKILLYVRVRSKT